MTYARWRSAALSRASASSLAILANMEAEGEWGEGRAGLPTISGTRRTDVVRRMDELGIWLASEEDSVLVSTEPDPDFVRYLRERNLFRGQFVIAHASDNAAERRFSQADLNTLRTRGAALVPMGNTRTTEAIAALGSLTVSSPAVSLSARVNAKTFSQILCERLAVPRPRSVSTGTLGQLRTALEVLLADVPKVCVKESLGVSGRGIISLDSQRAADRLLRMLSKQYGEDEPIDFVVEEWIEDALDLNYQLLIDERGDVTMIGLRSAHVVRGVHQGHRYPSHLAPDAVSELERYGGVIARSLRDDEGYFGVVGLDALITTSGTVYPCLEINARLNMSTFQNRIIDEYVQPGYAARFFFVRPPVSEPLDFTWYEERLRPLLYRPGDDRGVIIMAHSTAGSQDDRRLYLATIGRDDDDADTYRHLIEEALDSP